MTNKEVIEKIALFLICPVGNMIKTGFDCEEWNYAYDIAQKLCTKFESLGYVQLDPDQSLPDIPAPSNFSYDDSYITGYIKAQQDILKAGFKKVME